MLVCAFLLIAMRDCMQLPFDLKNTRVHSTVCIDSVVFIQGLLWNCYHLLLVESWEKLQTSCSLRCWKTDDCTRGDVRIKKTTALGPPPIVTRRHIYPQIIYNIYYSILYYKYMYVYTQFDSFEMQSELQPSVFVWVCLCRIASRILHCQPASMKIYDKRKLFVLWIIACAPRCARLQKKYVHIPHIGI